jgi:hypothetical protein
LYGDDPADEGTDAGTVGTAGLGGTEGFTAIGNDGLAISAFDCDGDGVDGSRTARPLLKSCGLRGPSFMDADGGGGRGLCGAAAAVGPLSDVCLVTCAVAR